jgi:hypothetical protein
MGKVNNFEEFVNESINEGIFSGKTVKDVFKDVKKVLTEFKERIADAMAAHQMPVAHIEVYMAGDGKTGEIVVGKPGHEKYKLSIGDDAVQAFVKGEPEVKLSMATKMGTLMDKLGLGGWKSLDDFIDFQIAVITDKSPVSEAIVIEDVVNEAKVFNPEPWIKKAMVASKDLNKAFIKYMEDEMVPLEPSAPLDILNAIEEFIEKSKPKTAEEAGAAAMIKFTMEQIVIRQGKSKK